MLALTVATHLAVPAPLHQVVEERGEVGEGIGAGRGAGLTHCPQKPGQSRRNQLTPCSSRAHVVPMATSGPAPPTCSIHSPGEEREDGGEGLQASHHPAATQSTQEAARSLQTPRKEVTILCGLVSDLVTFDLRGDQRPLP